MWLTNGERPNQNVAYNHITIIHSFSGIPSHFQSQGTCMAISVSTWNVPGRLYQRSPSRSPRPGGPDPALDPDLLLPHCWRIQDCSSCLNTNYHCSWCPSSSACVPNPVTWPLLAPIWKLDICPSRDERWELRGNELGCKVSTTTFLSVVVAVFSTVTLLILGWLLTLGWAWSRKRWNRWYMWWKEVITKLIGTFKGWSLKPLRKMVPFPWSRSRVNDRDGSISETTRLLG